jgi:glyoxylase-like metal-dependent hydrolase (beta-lactamase superfamily II)
MHVSFRRHASFIAGLCAALLCCACAPAHAQLVKPELLRQVSAHVHIIPDQSAPYVPNVGIIIGSAAALVIDPGMGPRNGAAVYAAAQKLAGNRQLYLLATHFHPEHDLGAQAFPASARMIRSVDQEKDIAEFGLQLAKVFAQRSPLNAELLEGAQFRPADIRFTTDYTLDLGGVRVRLYAMGPNHTRGDIAVYIEPDRVLFSGDIAMKAQPAFASPYSSLKHWLESLDQLQAMKPAIIVPSHGPTGNGVEFIEGYRSYLLDIQKRAAAEKRAGHSVEEAVSNISTAMGARYPDSGRLAGAARAAYAEAP